MMTDDKNCPKITTHMCSETVRKTISVGITDKERGLNLSYPNRAASYNKLTIQSVSLFLPYTKGLTTTIKNSH